MNKIVTVKNLTGQDTYHIIRQTGEESYTSFPIQADNPNWIALKTAILEDKAQLQDADGNTMTAEQAKDFVKSYHNASKYNTKCFFGKRGSECSQTASR